MGSPLPAVSWADYAAGRVLDELDALGLADDTLVVMHSDHGWHLGEYNMWEKRTLWENAARVPLVMRAPRGAIVPGGGGGGGGGGGEGVAARGARSSAPVELVDIYATVCDVLGVALPEGERHPVEGTSLLPLLLDPSLGELGPQRAGSSGSAGSAGSPSPSAASGSSPKWTKEAALTTYPRCPQGGGVPDWEHNSCIHSTERSDFAFMGYSMLHRNATDGAAYRYTEWLPWNGSALAPVLMDRAGVKAVELYNHSAPLPPGQSEFDSFENVNLARAPSTPPALLVALSAKLRELFALR